MNNKIWGWITMICGAWWITTFILMMTGKYTNYEFVAKVDSITLGIIMVVESVGFFLDDALGKGDKE